MAEVESLFMCSSSDEELPRGSAPLGNGQVLLQVFESHEALGDTQQMGMDANVRGLL